MTISYAFRDTLIEMTQDDRYTIPELKEAILQALDDPDCPKFPRLLCDMRTAAVFPDRTRDEIRTIAQFLIDHGHRFGRRLAMVVSSDLGFGLLRQGAADTEEGGIVSMVFRDIEEARAWLQSES